jgi:hypothetical protein
MTQVSFPEIACKSPVVRPYFRERSSQLIPGFEIICPEQVVGVGIAEVVVGENAIDVSPGESG